MEQRELIARCSIFVALGALYACSRAPQRDLFKEAETLQLDGKFSAAAELFRMRLRQSPDDAGAHYYLGVCYMSNCLRPDEAALKDPKIPPSRWLGIAQGELETALSLFERRGKESPIPRFTAEYFEMMCHVTQAKIYFIHLQAILDEPPRPRGLNMRVLVPGIVKKCIEQAEKAEKVSPNAPEVTELKVLIKSIIADVAVPQQPPVEPPPPAPEALDLAA